MQEDKSFLENFSSYNYFSFSLQSVAKKDGSLKAEITINIIKSVFYFIFFLENFSTYNYFLVSSPKCGVKHGSMKAEVTIHVNNKKCILPYFV